MKPFILGANIILLLLTGCSVLTTTPQSRTDAMELATLVKKYRLAQEQKIQQEDNQYQQAYDRLIKEEKRAAIASELNQFDLDALHLSDQIIGDITGQTMPSKFRDSFENYAASQVIRAGQTGTNIANARLVYANSYQNISVNLQKLKSIETGLLTLGSPPSDTAQLLSLMKTLYAAYQQTATNSTPAKTTTK